MTYSWTAESAPHGVLIQCLRKGLVGRPRLIPVSDWPSEKELSGTGLLSLLLMEENAIQADNGVRIPHEIVASLEEDQAYSIGLPPAIPHALQLRSSRTIDEPDFSISVRWLRYGATPVNIKRTGAIGFEGERRFRIPGRLLTVLESIESFQSADTETREARVEHWAPIQAALAATMGQDVRADGYLDDLRIFHAASLSLAVELSQEKGITFEPVLFGRADIRRQRSDLFEVDPLADPAIDEDLDDAISTEGVDTLIDQADALLPGELQRIFVEDRLGRDAACREAYPLVRNTYVIIDAPLRKALNVVKEKRQAPEDEKRAFVKNPRTAFADALGGEADGSALHGLFVETKQYADWVNGVGLWQPRVLPWLPRSSTSWLPEKIGFTINGQNVEIQPEKLTELKEACEGAIARARPSFDFEDLRDIPATVETLSAIESLQIVATRMAEEKAAAAEKSAAIDADETSPQDKFAVKADDNLEELQFKLGLMPREASIELVPPRELIDSVKLYPHQLEGFDWTVRSWTVGRPGILLADDMGLGKTIQTLAFAAWLHANDESAGRGNRGPILIVAPTALLQNWREEHDKHLTGGGIGPLVELYGGGIRSFKKDAAAGRDVVEGYGVLDRDLLGRTSCLLTTYETLANYQISFAGIRYPLVIFDEIQKLKTPTTINTHAAKTLNADFVIGLTGTPVENSLTELWSIMDRLHPGYLGDLKSFTSIYRPDDTGSLSELRDQLVKVEVGTSVMLRRMKDTTDLGHTLPARNYISLPQDMPEQQANAYENCVAEARTEQSMGASRGTMLKALHRMRGISLHPENPASVLGRPEAYDEYVGQSARLATAIKVLDEIFDRGEKALIFIEYREMQRVFADVIRHRFDLPALPAIINGQTPSKRRHELVSQFQEKPIGKFDAMILSPRAAGVGLNITAANHVIHLSRWWNPAVEDQCNDRAYRIGQDKEVSVYFPIARHPAFGDMSFDVKLDELLARKRALSRDLLIPAESESDYQNIFSQTVAG